jgi:uncharacterized membrane protein
VCYEAVVEADRVGANTTELSAALDEAGMLSSKARLAYEKGDFESAQEFARLSQERLEGLDVEADALAKSGGQQRSLDFIINVVGSLVGAVVVIIGSVGVWVFLNRKYGGEEGSVR